MGKLRMLSIGRLPSAPFSRYSFITLRGPAHMAHNSDQVKGKHIHMHMRGPCVGCAQKAAEVCSVNTSLQTHQQSCENQTHGGLQANHRAALW
jgi:hypothetical protein